MRAVLIKTILISLFTIGMAAWPINVQAEERPVDNEKLEIKRRETIRRGLDWLASQQAADGRWIARDGLYPTAMTAMAGMAFLGEGSTTNQGRYAVQIRRAIDFLVSRSQTNGLIGDPLRDDRYTYGHGFAMLFLSQILGEEEDPARRTQLLDILSRAVVFTGDAQTKAGGWGYVSAKDGNDFDEGSTTITQIQGLRSCRNAGVLVPEEIIERAVNYIRECTAPDGGVYYSTKSRGNGRPAITAAAIACLFNAGDYDSTYLPKMLAFAKKNLYDNPKKGYGFWHYSHYYYSQVLYRKGGPTWSDYRDRIYRKIISEAAPDGSWITGSIGPVYTTSINLSILQLENRTLPIYQR
jgi:hypothetical protein